MGENPEVTMAEFSALSLDILLCMQLHDIHKHALA